jgi:hypothetical protein
MGLKLAVVPLYGGFPFAVASTPGAAVGALAKVVMVYDVRPPFYLMERRGYMDQHCGVAVANAPRRLALPEAEMCQPPAQGDGRA